MSEDAGNPRSDQAPQSDLERAEQAQAALLAAPQSRWGWPGRAAKRLVRRLTRPQLLPQGELNASLIRSLRAVTARAAAAEARAAALEEHLRALGPDLDKSLGSLGERTSRAEAAFGELSSLATRSENIERHLGDWQRDIEADFATVRATLHAQGRQVDEVAGELVATTQEVEEAKQEWQTTLIEQQREQRATQERVRTLEKRLEPLHSLDHFDFARRYRGDEKVIRERLRTYAQVFGPVERVLDFGCGRGEFLEVCSEMSIGAYGVDSDPDMVSHCKLKRMDALQGDALEHLRGLPNRSLDGIFSAQVVEHLTPAQLAELIELAADKLKRGARVVIETINPNTFLALRWFFLDPSHCQPVPAELLRFFLEEANFEILDILYTSPVPEDERLATLKPERFDDPAAAEIVRLVNENSRRLNEAVFGMQDYAIIAER